MELSLLISFLGAAITLTLMPGPDNLYVLAESLGKGKSHGIYVTIGLCLGIIIHTTAVASGLSLLIINSRVAFTILKVFGASYLLYLAYLEWKSKVQPIAEITIEADVELNRTALVRKGFFMNVLNPKVALFFIALLPQFISKETAWSPMYQMMMLGFVFMLQAFILFSAISIGASRLRKYLQSERFWKITRWLTILVLIGIAILIILSKN